MNSSNMKSEERVMRLPQSKDKTYKVGSFISSLEKMQVEGRAKKMKEPNLMYNIQTKPLFQ